MKTKVVLGEYRLMGHDALVVKASEMRERLMKFKFKKASGRMENSAQLKAVRRDIARALTVLAESSSGSL